MMNHVIFLSNVSPGPACSIPEEKKIFRVSVDDAVAHPFNGSGPATDAAVGPEEEALTLPLPVPHMYSA